MKDLVKELKSLGCEVELIKGHWQVFRNGVAFCTMASTPGDRRSLLNAKSELRKLGIPLRRK